ncbi:hypothetical protein C1H46_001323 [Malus baccata]|uniref:Uncharacterized protein n=1 Tax=Malus baccata TaxID=106549 RepID=A0A540NQE3_MALBA|nr:hypothetical protein C1H46_001323 [Malus baccata]
MKEQCVLLESDVSGLLPSREVFRLVQVLNPAFWASFGADLGPKHGYADF